MTSRRPILAVLWTALFLVYFNIAIMIPILPFIRQDMGLTNAQSGIVLAAFPVAALVSNLCLGPWIDRYGRKIFLALGATGCAVLCLATAASRSFETLAASRVLIGLFMPMLGASVWAAIADYIPEADRLRAGGYVTSAAPIAFLISMSFGLMLGGTFAWQLPIAILALVAALLAVAASRLPATPPDGLARDAITGSLYRSRFRALAMTGRPRHLLVAFLAWSMATFVFLGLYPTWLVQHALADRSAGAIGAILFVGEVGGLLGALNAGRFADLHGRPLALCAFAAFATGLTVLAIPAGPGREIVQILAYGCFAFGRDLMLALLLGSAMSLVAAAERGSLNAMINAVYQVGATLGGVASAWLYGMDQGFWANAVASCLLFAASGAVLRTLSRPDEPEGHR